MTEFAEKYINPFTDFGFKKLFGEELNKDLLLDFLNELLKEEQGQIVNLKYLKTEHLGTTEFERKAIFDIYCENDKGDKFIVEMQKTKQSFFKDRTVYYSTFPIREQAKLADWNFELKAVYTIAILDFVFDADKNDLNKFRYDVKLKDLDTNEIFYDKLTFIYLEMPKFNKSVEELETRFDKWLYVLKNLNRINKVPDKLREKIFDKLFETAEIAKFTLREANYYEDSLKYYRDWKNTYDTARDEARAEGKAVGITEGKAVGIAEGKAVGIAEGKAVGIAEGKAVGIAEGKIERNIEIAKIALKKGVSVKDISEITGLSEAEINSIN